MPEPVLPTIQFNCPACHTPGSLPFPDGEILSGAKFTNATWSNHEWTCPGCLKKFRTVLAQIRFEGQIWGLIEIATEKGNILPPPPGFNPKGKPGGGKPGMN